MNIAAMKPATWAYSENFVGEDEVLTNARARAANFPAPPIGPGGGAALRFLAATYSQSARRGALAPEWVQHGREGLHRPGA